MAYKYYFTDHLGNVRAVLAANGDTVQTSLRGPATTILLMLWTQQPTGLTPTNNYLHQGQEHQVELEWNQYKWRNADPALGRFFNIDPLSESYLYNSTYAFSGNKLVVGVELEGLELRKTNDSFWIRYRFTTDYSYEGSTGNKLSTLAVNFSGRVLNAPLDFLDYTGESIHGTLHLSRSQLSTELSGLREWIEDENIIGPGGVYMFGDWVEDGINSLGTWEGRERGLAFGAEMLIGRGTSMAGRLPAGAVRSGLQSDLPDLLVSYMDLMPLGG